MKISNENFLVNIFASLLFLAGILILFKIGFVQWIICCSILFFLICQDREFLKSISDQDLENSAIYFVLWFLTIIAPIYMFLAWMYIKISGYRSMDD